jgi:spermidine synthase
MQKVAHFRWLYPLFFLSGFPALLYQIVWQRTLFAIYGVNIESVTVVVSAFMLGLGLGSLAGGRISRNPRAPLLLLFAAAEFGIAGYGLASLALFHRVAAFTAGAPAVATGLLSFALVVIPTILMGATLPLLVAQLVRISGNVGQSVGILYFVNTLGSAVACFAAGLLC